MIVSKPSTKVQLPLWRKITRQKIGNREGATAEAGKARSDPKHTNNLARVRRPKIPKAALKPMRFYEIQPFASFRRPRTSIMPKPHARICAISTFSRARNPMSRLTSHSGGRKQACCSRTVLWYSIDTEPSGPPTVGAGRTGSPSTRRMATSAGTLPALILIPSYAIASSPAGRSKTLIADQARGRERHGPVGFVTSKLPGSKREPRDARNRHFSQLDDGTSNVPMTACSNSQAWHVAHSLCPLLRRGCGAVCLAFMHAASFRFRVTLRATGRRDVDLHVGS